MSGGSLEERRAAMPAALAAARRVLPAFLSDRAGDTRAGDAIAAALSWLDGAAGVGEARAAALTAHVAAQSCVTEAGRQAAPAAGHAAATAHMVGHARIA